MFTMLAWVPCRLGGLHGRLHETSALTATPAVQHKGLRTVSPSLTTKLTQLAVLTSVCGAVAGFSTTCIRLADGDPNTESRGQQHVALSRDKDLTPAFLVALIEQGCVCPRKGSGQPLTKLSCQSKNMMGNGNAMQLSSTSGLP